MCRLELRVCRWAILSRDSNWPRRDRMQLMGLLDCRFHSSPGVRVTTDMDGNRLPRECRLRQWPLAGRSVSNTQGRSHQRPRRQLPTIHLGTPEMIRGLGLSGGPVSCLFIGNAARERREPGRELIQDGGGATRNERGTASPQYCLFGWHLLRTMYELIVFGTYHLGSR